MTEPAAAAATAPPPARSPPPLPLNKPVLPARSGVRSPTKSPPPVPPPKPTVLPLTSTTAPHATNGALTMDISASRSAASEGNNGSTTRTTHNSSAPNGTVKPLPPLHKPAPINNAPPLLKPIGGPSSSSSAAGSSSSATGSGAGVSGSGAGSGSSTGEATGGGVTASGEEASWKERCHVLETSLHKFKQQASKIRELLSQKMQEHEQRTADAERKWQEAEKRVTALEEEVRAARSSPEKANQKLHQLEMEIREKDKTISVIRIQLEEQRQMRIDEARLVEEKSARIKDWVSKKIKEHDEETADLKDDNATLRAQIEVLRLRLQALPAPAAREIHRKSIQEGDSRPESEDLDPPAIPKRPSSSILDQFRRERMQLEELGLDLSAAAEAVPHDLGHVQMDLSPDLDDHMDDHEDEDEADVDVVDDFEPVYQEIDDNHESKYAPKRSRGSGGAGGGGAGGGGATLAGSNGNNNQEQRLVPPQVRIERRVFPNPHLHPASMVSSTGSEDCLSTPQRPHPNTLPSAMSSSFEMTSSSETPLGSATPKGAAAPPSAQMAETSFMADPRTATHRHATHVVHHELPVGSSAATTNGYPPASASGGGEDMSASPHEGGTTNSGAAARPAHTGDEEYPYAVPHSTHMVSALATMPRRKKDNKIQINVSAAPRCNLPGTKDDSATIPQETARGIGFNRTKPPTPPMRRLPSWENRIYAIANVGLKVPDVSNGLNRESCFPVTDGLYTDHMYEDLSVPVYTTLKGKAAQIRSTPFTGDSSTDSSDNESEHLLHPVPHPLVPAGGGESEAVTTVAGPSGAKTTTSMVTKRKQVNQTSSGATKRCSVASHSMQSIVSDTSSDYAVPPDEVSIQTDSSDNSEPEQKLLKYTMDPFKKDSLERCGWLTKLGGKVKNWKRRWFVLKNGELLIYKSPNDVARKPQGYITLDGQTRVIKTEGAHTFEITTAKRTYYLTADSKDDMDHWIKVMQNVLKKQAADRVLGSQHAKEVMKGWIIKTKHGRCRRCWCVLVGKFFMYYKRPSDKTPLGQIHLRDARIEEVDRSCDSETDSDDTAIPDYTLGIWPICGGGPTYLMLPTKHEKDSWLYHLTVAAGGGAGNIGTEYEQILSKLMEADGDPNSVYWKHPVLLHSKEPISKPLTTLPSADLQEKTVDLFKSCQMFMSMAMDSLQIDYHVSLAQSILDVCLQHTELQNELYCQLLKQTSRHPPQQKTGVQNLLLCGSHSWFLCDASPTSPTSSVMDLSESKLNPVNYVFMQGWQLLAMSISLFLPKQSVLWYLKAHLQRNADPRTDVGKLAIFCQRALERTLHNGNREARPSRMEVMSILLRNPYHHSQPISIPVHFLNTTYQVVSFDGSTTVQEFLSTLNKAIGMRDCALSGFSLFTDDPAGQELEHCLKGHLKLCDVISKWEQAYLHHHSKRGRPDTSRTVKLTYKNRMYFKSLVRTETEKERLLLVYQVNDDIVNGRFPLNRDLAVELAALLAQIEYGDFCKPSMNDLSSSASRITPTHSVQQVAAIVDKFYPKRYKDGTQTEIRMLEQRVAEKWNALRARSVQDCVRINLTVARKWPFFGAKLFSARVKYGEPGQVWLAVQEDSVTILEYTTLKVLEQYDYKRVVTFGGCRHDFMLVVTTTEETSVGPIKTDRLLFLMSKPKILEVTMLMASYINTRGQHKVIPQASRDKGTRLMSTTSSQVASYHNAHNPSYTSGGSVAMTGATSQHYNATSSSTSAQRSNMET